MLAFRDKEALFAAVSATLAPGGRFAFTLEEGEPLTEAERAAMPDADTVWLTPLAEMRALLERAGMAVHWLEDWSEAHRAVADSLVASFTTDELAISATIGRRPVSELLAAHRLLSTWLASGRVRKLAVVAEKASNTP